MPIRLAYRVGQAESALSTLCFSVSQDKESLFRLILVLKLRNRGKLGGGGETNLWVKDGQTTALVTCKVNRPCGRLIIFRNPRPSGSLGRFEAIPGLVQVVSFSTDKIQPIDQRQSTRDGWENTEGVLFFPKCAKTGQLDRFRELCRKGLKRRLFEGIKCGSRYIYGRSRPVISSMRHPGERLVFWNGYYGAC